jgi:hypothetical protein
LAGLQNIYALNILSEKMIPERLEKLRNINDKYAWIGQNAMNWAMNSSLDLCQSEEFNKKFNKKDISRLLSNFKKENPTSIKETDKEILEICVLVFSWGGMKSHHGKALFENKSHWLPVVKNLINKCFKSRIEAFKKFQELRNEKNLPGCGIAYFTKLIYFLAPDLNGYILDQWTGLSINYLLDSSLVKLNTGYRKNKSKSHRTRYFTVNDNNSPDIYEKFCQIIETISDKFYGTKENAKEVEERIFSKGGKSPGEWRRVIKSHFEIKREAINYKEIENHNPVPQMQNNLQKPNNQNNFRQNIEIEIQNGNLQSHFTTGDLLQLPRNDENKIIIGNNCYAENAIKSIPRGYSIDPDGNRPGDYVLRGRAAQFIWYGNATFSLIDNS